MSVVGNWEFKALTAPSVGPFPHCAGYLTEPCSEPFRQGKHSRLDGKVGLGCGVGTGSPGPSTEVPGGEGEWGQQALLDKPVLVLRARAEVKSCLTRSGKGTTALLMGRAGCWDPAGLLRAGQEASDRIFYVIFSNQTQRSH